MSYIFALLLLTIVLFLGVVLVTWLFTRSKEQPKRWWASGTNTDWNYLPQPQTNALVPALLNMLLYQIMQSQQDQHQHEVEQFWMMQEPASDLPAFSDIEMVR